MNSKILIDWNEVPMITVKLPIIDPRPKSGYNTTLVGVSPDPYQTPYDDLEDARDKLTHKFINSGPFALIAGTDVGTYEIHSMNVLDVMQNILDIYGKLFHGEDLKLNGTACSDKKDFEQAVYKVCSMIESVSQERSTSFKEMAK